MTTIHYIYRIPGKKYLFKYPCENTSDCHPIELKIKKGTYRFELWGAGLFSSGGYVSGELHLYDEFLQSNGNHQLIKTIRNP